MQKMKESKLLGCAKPSRRKLGKVRGADKLARLDELHATLALEKINKTRRDLESPGDPIPRPVSQFDPVYADCSEVLDDPQANSATAGTSGASQTVQSPKKPPKPPKSKPKKSPKKAPKPNPKSPNVESPNETANLVNNGVSNVESPEDGMPDDYDQNECPYAVLDTESLNKPMPKATPAPKPKLPSTQEEPAQQQQQQQQPVPVSPVPGTGASNNLEDTQDPDETLQDPVYADIIGVLRN